MESFLMRHYRILFTVGMVAIAGLSFYVGILEGKQAKGDTVTLSCTKDVLSKLTIPLTALSTQKSTTVATGASTPPLPVQSAEVTGAFAGSKNGTKYYTPGCSGLNRIKPENLIWFQNAEDATLQGYTPANC